MVGPLEAAGLRGRETEFAYAIGERVVNVYI